MIVHSVSFLETVVSTYSSARVGTRHRPASFGDPDPLAGRNPVDDVAGVLDRLPEDVCGVLDGAVLEVGVAENNVSIWFINLDLARSLTRPCR